jgi:hypothetical protein
MCAITAARHATIVVTNDTNNAQQSSAIMKSDADWLDDNDEANGVGASATINNGRTCICERCA